MTELNIKAVLLAAGKGTRLKPLTDVIPKCLMPINGRPLIELWLRSLSEIGIKQVLVNLHHLPEMVKMWLANSSYTNYVIPVYEKVLLGTAGTVLFNRDFLNNETFILIHADNLCLADLGEFIQAHYRRPEGTEITMMTFIASNPKDCGIVEVDENGIVVGFYEKVEDPPGSFANAAVYMIEPSVIDFIEKIGKEEVDFSTEVLPHFVGKIFTYHNNIYHRDIGKLDSYLTAQYEVPCEPAVLSLNNDPWRAICFAENSKLNDRFYEALTTVLRPVDVKSLPDSLQSEIQDISQSERGEPFHLVQQVITVERKQLCSANVGNQNPHDFVIYFPEVGAGFSSRRIFAQYGYRSLALCVN